MSPESKWKIHVPTVLLNDVVKWFHQILGHAGQTRAHDSMRTSHHHTQLKQQIERCRCSDCERHKQIGRGFGHSPHQEAILMRFEEAHVDLIGPWKVEMGEGKIEIKALTCIDSVSNSVELMWIENKTS